MPSIKDVANKAGVSTATVSRVINNTSFVSSKVKKRVLKAMDELDYQPNLAAKSLRSKKSNIIGLLMPDIANPFYMNVIKGIEKVMRENSYNILVSNSDDDIEIEKQQLKIFNSQLVDGLIMRATHDDHSFLNKYFDNCPIVFVDCKPINFTKGDMVLANNIEGSFRAINMLLKNGHKKIGYIGGIPTLTTTEERKIGYKKALLHAGLNPQDSLIKLGNSRIDSGYKFAAELVKKEKVTAIFSGNNLITLGVMKFLKEQNIIIPDEVSVVGFDDIEWASFTDPKITTIKQPSKKIGIKAAKLLLQRIQSENEKKYQEYRLAVNVISRNSI